MIMLSTLEFTAEMLVDYVHVYRHKGQTNIGGGRPDYPTANYIAEPLDTGPYLGTQRYPRFGGDIPQVTRMCLHREWGDGSLLFTSFFLQR